MPAILLQSVRCLIAALAQATAQASPVAVAPTPENNWLLQLFKDGTFYLAAGIEAGAGIIIGIASIQAIVLSLSLFVRAGKDQQATENIRLNLGRWLAVALEFELAADILRTAVAPSWNEIGQLAAIIILRTVLNYFLQQEIDKAAQREGGISPASLSTPASTTSAAQTDGLLTRVKRNL